MTADGVPPPQVAPRPDRERRGGRSFRRVPILILVLGCLVAAMLYESTRPDAEPARAQEPSSGASLPAPDDVSSSWFCAEGTAQPDGRANETIVVANVGSEVTKATITVLPASEDQRPESRRLTVDPGEQVRVAALDIMESAEQLDPAGVLRGPGVIVEALGGRSIVEHEIEGQEDFAVGPCTRAAGREWYFGAGTTERGAEQYLSIFNPFEGDAIVDVQFITEEGVQSRADLQALVVPRRTRVTVPVQDYERRRARIATRVTARTGRVVVEQSNAFTAEHETRRGIALSLGSPRTAHEWTFPSVSGGSGTTQSVSVANFAPTATDIEVLVRGDQGVVDPETVPLPGRSTVVIDLGPRVTSSAPVTILVRSLRSAPVVVEQTSSFDATETQGVASTVGAFTAAPRWAFALGRLEAESVGLITAYNVGRTPTTVRVVTYVGTRRDVVEEQDLDGGTPAVFDLEELGVDPDQVVLVEADAPVIVGRMITGPAGRSIAVGVLASVG